MASREMDLKQIERAIKRLQAKELAELMGWLDDYRAQTQDKQTEEDLGAGRLDGVLAEAKEEYEAGLSPSLELELDIPEDLFALLGFSRSSAAEAMREFSVLGLYLEQRISAGKAAELMGLHKRGFVRLLARKGIPYLDYTDEELDREFQTFDEWRRKQDDV